MCDGALSVVDMNYDMHPNMRGHGDRNESLKSVVKSKGKPTHAQSIF